MVAPTPEDPTRPPVAVSRSGVAVVTTQKLQFSPEVAVLPLRGRRQVGCNRTDLFELGVSFLHRFEAGGEIRLDLAYHIAAREQNSGGAGGGVRSAWGAGGRRYGACDAGEGGGGGGGRSRKRVRVRRWLPADMHACIGHGISHGRVPAGWGVGNVGKKGIKQHDAVYAICWALQLGNRCGPDRNGRAVFG